MCLGTSHTLILTANRTNLVVETIVGEAEFESGSQ